MKLTIIGLTDTPQPQLNSEEMWAVLRGKVFSGGRRHHELVERLLPADAVWIDITPPLAKVFEQYRQHDEIVVFASGDPLFFGFANTARRELPQAQILTYPAFNSLQLLVHRLVMPYHDMNVVSLTGRPWHEFDRVLIEGKQKIGVLTDKEHNPAAIAARMLEFGYSDYKMAVGEHLGHPDKERVREMGLKEARIMTFSQPNCLILAGRHERRMSIPDHEFMLLDGRERMITKNIIRTASLHALELWRRHDLWDVGFCTGSVSIEARLQFPHVEVQAFEIRPECERIIAENSRRFGVPGINVHVGDFLAADCPTLPRPDAVFIGGHGGKLREIMKKVKEYLLPGGVIVMNSVTAESRKTFEEAAIEYGMELSTAQHIQLNEYNPIDILKCELRSSS